MKSFLKKITLLYKLYLWLLRKKQTIYNKFLIPDYRTKRNTILRLAKKYRCTDVFIETGTFMGDTVDYLKNDFKRLISIELNNVLALKAKRRFQNTPNVQIFQGDSASMLSTVLSTINVPILFWLDGHYSSGFHVGNEYITTGRGTKDTPVMEELLQIKNHSVKQHLILIDDARLFNGINDYPTVEEVKLFVKEHLPACSFSVRKDIIRIVPKKNQ